MQGLCDGYSPKVFHVHCYIDTLPEFDKTSGYVMARNSSMNSILSNLGDHFVVAGVDHLLCHGQLLG